MESVIRFLLQIEGWIYFVCGSILIFSIIQIFRQAKELRLAVFGLEQEVASRKLRRYVSSGIGSLMLIGTVLFLASFSLVKYPGIRNFPTPTDFMVQTLTPISDNEFSQVESIGTIENFESNCEEGKIEWVFPLDGDNVQGIIKLTGTVNVENFAFYRYSYREVSKTEWTIIAVGSQQVIDGSLGSDWDTSNIEAGEYQLGLFVYDISNSLLPTCIIEITILDQ